MGRHVMKKCIIAAWVTAAAVVVIPLSGFGAGYIHALEYRGMSLDSKEEACGRPVNASWPHLLLVPVDFGEKIGYGCW